MHVFPLFVQINDVKLRQHFSQKGEVTDVKLKYNSENKFRGFAFVGYRTPDAAVEARDYFDKTYVGACRITVELCTSLGLFIKLKIRFIEKIF